MRALRVLSTAALLASFAGGCTRTRDPEPGGASADRAPARWRQVAVAPPRREHHYHREELVFSDWDRGDPGFLVHDLGGGRWFFPCAAAGAPLGLPRVQRSFPTSRGQLRLDDRDALDAQGFLLRRATVIDVPTRLFSTPIPADAEASSVRVLGGVATVWTERGLVSIREGQAPRRLGTLTGYEPREAAIDGEGHGVGLFVPERIALTHDGGATWKPVTLPDVHVRQLDVVRDRVLATPGGLRDELPRDVDVHTGEATRAAWPRPAPCEPPKRHQPPMRPPSYPATPGVQEEDLRSLPVRLDPSPTTVRHERSFAIDGDAVVGRGPRLTDHPGKDPQAKLLAWGMLGEPLVPLPGDQGTVGEDQRIAMCRGVIAVISYGVLTTFRNGTRLGSLEMGLDADVAFDAGGRLWTASKLTAASWGSRLRRLNPDALKDAPIDEQDAPIGPEPATFVGGCGRAALWIHSPGLGARLVGDRFGEGLPVQRGTEPVGVDAQGNLLALSSEEERGANTLHFSPSGERATLPATMSRGFSLASDGLSGLVSTNEDGILQTDDGGRTWLPIDAPAGEHRLTVVCGATRCLLGNSAIREGFGRVPSQTEAGVETTAPRARTRRQVVEEPEPRTVTRCVRDGTFFPGLVAEEVDARVGRWLFASTSPNEPDGSSTNWLGDVSGARVSAKAGTRGLGGTGFSGPTLFESTGRKMAYFNAYTGILTLLDGRRAEPRSTLDPPDRHAIEPGVLHEHRDGDWYTFRGMPLARGELAVLGRQPRDALPIHRQLLLGGEHLPETALGFLPGDRPSVVLLERVLDDASGKAQIELRTRPVAADLTLGEPTPIAGTRGAADASIALPVCTETAIAIGSVVHLEALAPVRIMLDQTPHTTRLVRLLRVTQASACVERTFFYVQERNRTVGTLVLEGDGGRGFSIVGGVRCDRVQGAKGN